jgi:hypothetical protein
MIVSLLPKPLPHNVITFGKKDLLWTDQRGALGSRQTAGASF